MVSLHLDWAHPKRFLHPWPIDLRKSLLLDRVPHQIRLIRVMMIDIRFQLTPLLLELANQFSNYDNDDGRSSRACQDVEDEECFNQLRVELTSECEYWPIFSDVIESFSLSRVLVGTTSPGWNASLSEHVLKNLRTTDIPLSEKDIQDNLNMLETKLR